MRGLDHRSRAGRGRAWRKNRRGRIAGRDRGVTRQLHRSIPEATPETLTIMDNKNARFAGSIPAAYDRYLGPILFQPYAEDLAARLDLVADSSVLELACGTGILTRVLRDRLPKTIRLVASGLNEPMIVDATTKFAH